MIGQEVAKRFTQEGYKVIAADQSSEADFTLDLSKEDEVERLFDEVFEDSYDSYTLINCQAIADPYTGFIGDLDASKWQEYMDANLLSYFLTCKAFAKRMGKSKSGSVINLSSTRRLMAEKNTEAYCATKGAITSFSKALSISLGGRGIRVNSISPGWIASEEESLSTKDHEQHPAGRVGTPLDIAQLCLFLSSSKSSFITGQDIVIDGGMSVKMIYES